MLREIFFSSEANWKLNLTVLFEVGGRASTSNPKAEDSTRSKLIR